MVYFITHKQHATLAVLERSIKMCCITEKIAEFIAGTDYDQIPQEVLKIAKRGILDCLGVALAGSVDPVGKVIIEFVRKIGGEPRATIIGGGFKSNPVSAALANGVMAHALDYDDIIPGLR